MRTLSPNVVAEAGKEQNRPVELYQIYLDQQTLFFAAHPQNIDYFDENGAPVTYYSLALARSPVKTNMDTRVDEVTVRLDNVNREMSAYIAQTDFVGRRLKIIKVFLDYLSSPSDHLVVFDGIMDEPQISQHAMQVTVLSKLDVMGLQVPRRRYQRHCNWKFGSTECGINLASVTVTGTVQAISADRTTLTLSGRTEAVDYFKDGILTIRNERMRVVTSDGPTITVDYPFNWTQVGDAYTLRRGCDKTYETCRDRFANTARYGGFLSIPAQKRV